MTASEFSALLVLATATSFTPGPNTTLSTALAANGGLPRALRFIAAVPVGWGLLFTLCAAGVGSLVVAVPALRWAILLGGTVYLLWLARRLWGSRSLSSVDSSRLNVGFWQGVGLQFLNIKAWMLALSIVAGWIAGQADAQQRFVAVLPVLLAFAFFSNLSYALVGSLLRHWLAGPVVHGQPTGARLLVFNRGMALALVLTAAWMLLGGAGLNGGAA
ncbi:LysE family translocator [Hydrogenophaga pseudoflava]|jgi:threonine/homoserine/homoserine lactone efflux protein|uniref:Cysteine/O-acetylserine efflux protein n=1 Tax=Hydrogenophaga pseudoflava TaxID=47421 RepID=A0A4P6X6T7_HYDPS|nr:LysE family transporter [Hydrogenophaga pseudoflava]QBM30238.1 Cysteine/O-acetylserine efflux protein [Hydrogenophaga pseudoflava]